MKGGMNSGIHERRVLLAAGSTFARVAAIGMAVVTIAACGQVDLKWAEEVRLADGTVIVVKRGATGEKLGEIGGPGGWEQKEMSVEIDNPPPNAIRPPVWRTAYVPMLLDYDAARREWRIVATFYTCQGWYNLGRPKLPYVEYRAGEGGQWAVVPLEIELIGRRPNLLTGVRSGGEPSLLTLEAKRQRDTGAADEYRRIVDVWRTNC